MYTGAFLNTDPCAFGGEIGVAAAPLGIGSGLLDGLFSHWRCGVAD